MARRVPTETAAPKLVRCAVYTRKSTEEGLEQEYNSLDAQFDACAAYIASQLHEGWTIVRERYDDGGFSGGTMERPGLKRLLADVAAGQVQVIVLYKVDRLTRSLSDFSKIVDVLDKAGASFVSVTQAFNTTTSMGRLMLNVLLSFAQFEREVTGERIRDKVAASKKKGMWMGGNVPLGYDVVDRKLVVNEAEAATVRHIFTRYLALGAGGALIEELREQGYRTKLKPREGKPSVGGLPFTRGMLFHLLKNRLYLGQVVHRGEAYPGEHRAIIDKELFEAVQRQIEGGAVERTTARNISSASLLTGILRDGLNRRMSPSHACKAGKRYRYYITHSAELRSSEPTAWRLPARDLETIVTARLRQLLLDRTAIRNLLPAPTAAALATALERGAEAAGKLDASYGRSTTIAKLVTGVRVDDAKVELTIHRDALLTVLDGASDPDQAPLLITAPAVRIRRGKDVKLVFANETGTAVQPDAKLVALLVEAGAARTAIAANPGWTVRDAASAVGQCRHRFARLIRLSFLAPELVQLILNGKHPPMLTPRRLLDAELPLAWREQKAMLGFG